jgi:uridine phosphorylase
VTIPVKPKHGRTSRSRSAPPPRVPLYSGKWRYPALVDARTFTRKYFSGVRTPERCILVWSPGLVEPLIRKFKGRRIAGLGETYRLPEKHGSLGFTVPRGSGSPATIIRSEELAAMGTKEFLGVGYAGSLSPELSPGEIVVCTGAIRDEGTSYHYAPPAVAATPSPGLTHWVQQTLEDAGLPYRTGMNWTVDAPYRETRQELRRFRREGILTVDMEASAMYIFGRSRHVRAASVFVISDVLREERWEPHFHRVGGRLEEVAGVLLRAWSRPVDRPHSK